MVRTVSVDICVIRSSELSQVRRGRAELLHSERRKIQVTQVRSNAPMHKARGTNSDGSLTLLSAVCTAV